MATRKSKAFIEVKEYNLQEIKEILKKGSAATFEEKVGAAVVLDSLIGSLKGVHTQLKEQIEKVPYDEITKDFVDRGKMESGESPVIRVGKSFDVSIGTTTKTTFTVENAKLSEIDSIIPDRYKKVVTSYDKKALEEAYDKGELETILKPYVNKDSETVVKFTKKKVEAAS